MAVLERTKAAPAVRLGRVSPSFLFVAVAGLAVAVLLPAGRSLGFFEDDWQFILARPFTLEAAFARWGEHWPVIHFLVYRTAYELSGGSFLVLHTVHIGVHVAAAAGLFTLLQREASTGYALGASAIFLLAAPGWENLLWAFQIGFVLAMAFGFWALVVRDARVSALLLGLGVMTAGSVVPFIGVALLRALLERDWRGFAWRTLPLALYLAWLVLGGSAGERASGYMSWDPAALGSAPTYIAVALDGLGRDYLMAPFAVTGLLVLAIVVGIAVKPSSLAVASLVALLAYPVMLAFSRNEFGPTVTLWSRHVYAMTPWVLLAAAPLASVAGRRPLGRTAGAALLALVLIGELSGVRGVVVEAGHRIANDRAECRFGCP